jgi:hypothetical protein
MATIADYSFYVSSDKRQSGTNTDMNIQMSQIITRQARNSHFRATVHGATIPFSFYQLSNDIKSVTAFIQQGANSTGKILNMTVGNYSTVSVLEELSAKLTTICQGNILPCTSFTPTFNFVYNTTTSKSSLTMLSVIPNTPPANTTVITLLFGSNLSLGLFFGFTANAVFSIGLSATGSQPAVANPVSYLLLRSPSLRQYKNREWIVEKDVFSDILYHIPIQTNVNTYINWYGDSHPVSLVNDTLSNMNFYLTTNLSYTPIDLQDLSWSFRMTISEVLQPNYDSLYSTAFVNQPFANAPQETDATTGEMAQLEIERADAIKRIERYKKKLDTKKIADKLETSKNMVVEKPTGTSDYQ